MFLIELRTIAFLFRLIKALGRIDLENVLRIKTNNNIRFFEVRHDPIIKVKL